MDGRKSVSESSLYDAQPVLQAQDVSVQFWSVRALSNVSMSVRAGEICGLIRPNGAGKSTFLNAVTRLVTYGTGTIALNGKLIEGAKVRDMIGLGVVRRFQNLGIYASMTVLENVMLGEHHHLGGRFGQAIFNPLKSRMQERIAREKGDCRACSAGCSTSKGTRKSRYEVAGTQIEKSNSPRPKAEMMAITAPLRRSIVSLCNLLGAQSAAGH
ncbi:hypothetical protein A6U94_23835 [Agrobacterium tumefaciens]|nr:ATP-binding cassette domain-containing protein [Agrobacterium tumefaciens]OCJ58627.1 hypothetical protein A6U94_23835 [Agrobacterium tumefaciens]